MRSNETRKQASMFKLAITIHDNDNKTPLYLPHVQKFHTTDGDINKTTESPNHTIEINQRISY